MRSTPSPDPDHPEHRQRRQNRQRWARQRTQLFLAALVYAVVATLLMVIPGMVFDSHILFGFFAVAAGMGWMITRNHLGMFAAMFLQGSLSTAFLLSFPHAGVFVFFMLLGHIVLPAIWQPWVEMIESGHG